MSKVQHIDRDPVLPRVETGAVQFGYDWPGLFVRGDEALYIAMQIQALDRALQGTDLDLQTWMARLVLGGLRRTILDAVQVTAVETSEQATQELKSDGTGVQG